MTVHTDSKQQIFTFDKITEKKSGALTMLIFSVCLLVFPIILMTIAGIGLDLGGHLLSGMTAISIADGAIAIQMEIIYACVAIIFGIALVLVFTYGIAALGQLLFAYAVLPNGRLIKLKWKMRGVHSAQAHVIARKVAKKTSTGRATAYRAVSGIYAFFEGLEMIHNPSVIAGHLDGSEVYENIVCLPLDNVEVLKKTKRKLVIMADTPVKNKSKRKKIKIYRMYKDMDSLCRLCEGGYSIVHQ